MQVFTLDSLNLPITILGMNRDLFLLGHDFQPLFSNASIHAATFAGTICGQPVTVHNSSINGEDIVIKTANNGQYRLQTLAGLPNTKIDWSGTYGNGALQGAHPLHGDYPDCLDADNIIATMFRNQSNLTLFWTVCGHLDWTTINGYHIWYNSTQSDTNFTEIAFIPVMNSERFGSCSIPLSSLGLGGMFYITADPPRFESAAFAMTVPSIGAFIHYRFSIFLHCIFPSPPATSSFGGCSISEL